MDKRIGAQLYTIRDFLKTEDDFYQSMKKLSEIGYKQVQASGVGIENAQFIKQTCDEFNLEITCTHRPFNNYINSLEDEIKYHKTLGCKIAGLGGMPAEFRNDAGILKFIDIMNTVYNKLQKEGIEFSYHNHSFEFLKFNGKSLMDYLMEFGKFTFIIDTYWLAFAGISPTDFIKKYGHRISSVHYKDMAMASEKEVKMVPIGDGNLNWDSINAVCEEAGVKYALVEQDICEEDPFICLKKSYDYLTKKGFN